jgi:hypothetical protein
MATKFKNVNNDDITTTKTPLHEAIPLTGTIVSGTYSDNNIKNYSHGMFQSVYDYPYLSSSANHIFDITCGYSSKSDLSGTSNVVQQDKKMNLYNQMAQVLVGHDITGSILEFDQSGDLADVGTKMREVFFLNFSRLITKDEIKKGSFALTFLTGGNPVKTAGLGGGDYTIKDYNAATTYKANSPAGEYGILYSGSAADAGTGIGLLYYQAGIAVLTASIFDTEFGPPASSSLDTGSVNTILTGTNISSSCDGIRNRFKNLSFNNTTELNSAIYFCRVNHNEFNYSSNPTFLSSSTIRVKEVKDDPPMSYFTTVGLYNSENVLMAVAKLSEPLKKSPNNEFTLRVRLDY